MYSDLKRETRLVASSLWKRGFTVNDRVLIMANNQVEFPIMFFGSWVAGGANITLTLNLLKGKSNFSKLSTVLEYLFNLLYRGHQRAC